MRTITQLSKVDFLTGGEFEDMVFEGRTDDSGVAIFKVYPGMVTTSSYNFCVDNADIVESCSTTSKLITRVCNTSPNCTGAKPSKSILWPPNHKFHDITINGVSDVDGDSANIRIASIYSDEETATASGAGGAIHAPDAYGVGTNTALLRADSSGVAPHNGRVYTIGFAATDGRGGACNGVVEVGVPHDKKDIPVNDGPLYDATI